MTNVIKILLSMFLYISCNSNSVYAQGKINNERELQMAYSTTDGLGSLVDGWQELARIAIGAALSISLIVVIYHVANDAKYGKGKQAVVSWLIAVAIYLVAINIRVI